MAAFDPDAKPMDLNALLAKLKAPAQKKEESEKLDQPISIAPVNYTPQAGDSPLTIALAELKMAIDSAHPTAGTLLEKVLMHARQQPDQVMLLSDEQLVPFVRAMSVVVDQPKATVRAAAKAADSVIQNADLGMWD